MTTSGGQGHVHRKPVDDSLVHLEGHGGVELLIRIAAVAIHRAGGAFRFSVDDYRAAREAIGAVEGGGATLEPTFDPDGQTVTVRLTTAPPKARA